MTEQQIINSEVLYGAADHIAAFGHCKRRLHGEGDPQTASACALGALKVAAGNAENDEWDWTRPAGALMKYLGEDVSIAGWNNAPERTAAEVIETLRATALIEQAREDAARESELAQVSA